jgi:hypothetical protein
VWFPGAGAGLGRGGRGAGTHPLSRFLPAPKFISACLPARGEEDPTTGRVRDSDDTLRRRQAHPPFTVHTPHGGCFACSPCLPPPVVGRGRPVGAAAGQRLMGRRPVGVAGAEGRQLERGAGRSRCV